MTATEWIEEWLQEFPSDKLLVKEARERGETAEEIQRSLQGNKYKALSVY